MPPPGGIRTHNLSRRAAADLRFRPRGHWDRLKLYKWSSVILICHTGLRRKCINLKLMKNKDYHEKKTAHWYSVTSLFLKPLKQRLIDVTSFRLSF